MADTTAAKSRASQQAVSRSRAAGTRDRIGEQARLDPHQDVDDAAGATVTAVERMDRLELVMRDGHPSEQIEIVVGMGRIVRRPTTSLE